jgi:very-short-patch-repair endonuclease
MPKKVGNRKRRASSGIGLGLPRMDGELSVVESYYPKSHIRRYADCLRKKPTPAERTLCSILKSLNGGVLKGRFASQHVVSGKWIVDIFFPEIRLGIEIDGGVHLTSQQRKLDKQKELDCARFDITLLRLTNKEVFGDRQKLVEKLRLGWKMALQRENKIIGKAGD